RPWRRRSRRPESESPRPVARHPHAPRLATCVWRPRRCNRSIFEEFVDPLQELHRKVAPAHPWTAKVSFPLRLLLHHDISRRALMRAQAASFAVVVIEYVMAAVAGRLNGLEHCVVGAQRPAVVAGQALAAGKTSMALIRGLRMRQPGFDLGLGRALGRGADSCLRTRRMLEVLQIQLSDPDGHLRRLLERCAAQIGVDGFCRTTPVANRAAYRARSARVAAYENALRIFEPPPEVRGEKRAPGEQLFQPRRVDLLANRRDDLVNVENRLGALESDRPAAAVGPLNFLHVHHFGANHTLAADYEAAQAAALVNDHPLLDCLADFALGGAHRVARRDIATGQRLKGDHMHFGGAGQAEHARQIDRGVAAADNCDAPPCGERADRYPFLENVEGGARVARNHPVGAPFAAALGSRREKYSRMRRLQLLDCEIAAEPSAGIEFDPDRK